MVYQFMLYAKSRVQFAEELVLDDEMGTHGLGPVAPGARTGYAPRRGLGHRSFQSLRDRIDRLPQQSVRGASTTRTAAISGCQRAQAARRGD